MGMEQDLRELLDTVVGEPPRRVTVVAVRRRMIRRRATQALSAGLAAVLVCGLGAAWSAGAIRFGPAPAVSIRPAGPPRYYVASDIAGRSTRLVVRDTATGRVTATIRPPLPKEYCNYFAAAEHQTFFLACSVPQTASRPFETVIYRFQVTGAGQVTGLRPIPGGTLKQMMVGNNIAVAPDGSEVAAEVLPTGQGPTYTNSIPTGIFVINTRTGHRARWRTGPDVPGKLQFADGTDLSFTQHGDRLVVLESRCLRNHNQSNCPNHGITVQVRSYTPATGGGSLEAGRIVLRPSQLIPRGTNLFDAFVTPDGSALTALLNHCPRRGLCTQTVARLPITGGGAPQALYRVRAGTAFKGILGRFFSSDPTGRYVIIDSQVGNARVNGWISHGRLRRLTPANGDEVNYETW